MVQFLHRLYGVDAPAYYLTMMGPTAIRLLAYFASCSLPNIPLPLFCRVDVVEFGTDAVRCVPMLPNAVIQLHRAVSSCDSTAFVCNMQTKLVDQCFLWKMVKRRFAQKCGIFWRQKQ